MAPKKKGKKRAGSSDFDEALSDDFSDDLDRKLPTPAPALPPPAPALAPVAAPVLIEELWAQCDRCQKWRLLPPGTPPPPDNVPWCAWASACNPVWCEGLHGDADLPAPFCQVLHAESGSTAQHLRRARAGMPLCRPARRACMGNALVRNNFVCLPPVCRPGMTRAP